MVKKIKAIIKLQIPAGQATPAPPVGPSLAPHGININEFCQSFNEKTKEQSGWIVPVEIEIFEDSPALSPSELAQFHFEVSCNIPGRKSWVKIKQPPASELLKRAAGLKKGSGEPRKTKVGTITREQLREIAKRKMEDLNTADIEKAMKTMEGTAKNMGILIE